MALRLSRALFSLACRPDINLGDNARGYAGPVDNAAIGPLVPITEFPVQDLISQPAAFAGFEFEVIGVADKADRVGKTITPDARRQINQLHQSCFFGRGRLIKGLAAVAVFFLGFLAPVRRLAQEVGDDVEVFPTRLQLHLDYPTFENVDDIAGLQREEIVQIVRNAVARLNGVGMDLVDADRFDRLELAIGRGDIQRQFAQAETDGVRRLGV